MVPPVEPRFFTGTSNITLPVPNKQAFPEAFRNASRLTYYASLFNSLEVNSSFYKIPMARTVEGWLEQVPDDFRFTFKLNRDLTHDKTNTVDPELVKRFMATINAGKEKAGSLLIQFPPGKTYNAVFLERLLVPIQKEADGWDVCVEFRHPSWYRDDVYRLLEAHRTAIVVHDKSKPGLPQTGTWTDFSYFRFHGPDGNYKGMYDVGVLQERAAEMAALLQQGKTVYAYFNNTAGSAVFDALALQELVTGKVTYAP